MLGANLFPLLEIERKREDAYSKTEGRLRAIVAETFYKWTYLSVNVQTPSVLERALNAQVRTIKTRLFVYPPFRDKNFNCLLFTVQRDSFNPANKNERSIVYGHEIGLT